MCEYIKVGISSKNYRFSETKAIHKNIEHLQYEWGNMREKNSTFAGYKGRDNVKDLPYFLLELWVHDQQFLAKKT